MYNYFIENPIMAGIFIVLMLIVAVLVLVKVMKTLGFEKIRAIVYKGFVTAENQFNQGDNTEKFEYVVNLAKSAIPSPFNLFITEKSLRKVVQLWFDLCKDLLDDGKLNNTTKQ